MSENPVLAKYRRQVGEPAVEENIDELTPDDGKTYLPYRPGNKLRRLIIKRRKEAHCAWPISTFSI